MLHILAQFLAIGRSRRAGQDVETRREQRVGQLGRAGNVGDDDDALEFSQRLEYVQMLAVVRVRGVSEEGKDLDYDQSEDVLAMRISGAAATLL